MRSLWHRISALFAIQPGHTFVTSGLYAVVRHPSYLGGLIALVGWAVVFRSSFFFSSRRRHTRCLSDWSSDVCSSDLIRSVAFSPDDKSLLSGSNDRSARLWDVVSGQELLALKHKSSVHLVAFSPDGKRSEERRVGKECRARRWRCREDESRRTERKSG